MAQLQSTGTANWRETIRKNQHKTYAVVTIFLVIFFILGFLIDFALYYSSAGHTTSTNQSFTSSTTTLAPGTLFYQFITLQRIPIATLIALAVAIIWIGVALVMYDRLMLMGTQYRRIDPNSSDALAQRVYNTTEEMKIAAGMDYMPKVYIMESDQMNAFASGYSEKSAMIVVTSALANALTRDELQAVIAHELTHIRHQDIKLTLFTTLLANMLLIMVTFLFYSTAFSRGGRDKKANNIMAIIFLIALILRIVLPWLTAVILLFLSRTREYMADAGAVELMRTNEPMATALLKIQNNYRQQPKRDANDQQQQYENIRRPAYIFDPKSKALKQASDTNDHSDLLSTHPSLKKRLRAIGFKMAQE